MLLIFWEQHFFFVFFFVSCSHSDHVIFETLHSITQLMFCSVCVCSIRVSEPGLTPATLLFFFYCSDLYNCNTHTYTAVAFPLHTHNAHGNELNTMFLQWAPPRKFLPRGRIPYALIGCCYPIELVVHMSSFLCTAQQIGKCALMIASKKMFALSCPMAFKNELPFLCDQSYALLYFKKKLSLRHLYSAFLFWNILRNIHANSIPCVFFDTVTHTTIAVTKRNDREREPQIKIK